MVNQTIDLQGDRWAGDRVPGLDPATVTIPVSEYAELLACRKRLEDFELLPDDLCPLPASAIERDREVAAFLASRFGQTAIDSLLQECRGRFGHERTPSRSATYRYRDRLRAAKEASKNPLKGLSKPRKRGRWSFADLDPDLALYIQERQGIVPATAIHAECVSRFGKGRAPSLTSIYAYLLRLSETEGVAERP